MHEAGTVKTFDPEPSIRQLHVQIIPLSLCKSKKSLKLSNRTF